jgi:hypothetical protein
VNVTWIWPWTSLELLLCRLQLRFHCETSDQLHCGTPDSLGVL